MPPPCNCAAGPVVDVPALVSAAARSNDDLAAGLDPAAIASAHGATSFDLPCGTYYLPSLQSDDTLELRVHGRAALFIGGDVTLAAGLTIALDSGAELDLVVVGNVSVATGVLGAATPSAARLWLASSTVHLGAGAALSAVVYAPAALLLADQDLLATGALFVRSLSATGDVSVRFDSSVLADGASCATASASAL